MASEFEKRLNNARLAEAAGKKLKGEGGIPELPPPGEYACALTDMRGMIGKNSGAPMLLTEFTILSGEQRGAKFADFTGLEQDFLVARVRSRIAQFGYEPPDEMIDYAESQRRGEFILSTDLLDVCNTIAGEEPVVTVRLKHRSPPGGGGPYADVTILDVQRKAEADTPEENPRPAEERDSRLDVLMSVAAASRIDIPADADLETVKAKLDEYSFWERGCSAEQVRAEYGADAQPENGVTPGEALVMRGVGIAVMAPEAPEAPKPKAPPKLGGTKVKGKR